MKTISPAILLLCSILLSCASGHHEPFAENPPIARDLGALETELRVLCDGSELLELEKAGRVEYDGFSAPIWVVRHRPFGAERRVLITGGVHGNEPGGSAWVAELSEWIAREPQLFENSDIDLVPLVNPWGWSRDIRFNRDGKDISREVIRQIRSLGYPIEQIETPTHLSMEDRLRMHGRAIQIIFHGAMK
jgi:hypothetical protein